MIKYDLGETIQSLAHDGKFYIAGTKTDTGAQLWRLNPNGTKTKIHEMSVGGRWGEVRWRLVTYKGVLHACFGRHLWIAKGCWMIVACIVEGKKAGVPLKTTKDELSHVSDLFQAIDVSSYLAKSKNYIMWYLEHGTCEEGPRDVLSLYFDDDVVALYDPEKYPNGVLVLNTNSKSGKIYYPFKDSGIFWVCSCPVIAPDELTWAIASQREVVVMDLGE